MAYERTPDEDAVGSWDLYRKHVLSELGRMNDKLETLSEKMQGTRDVLQGHIDGKVDRVVERLERQGTEIAMLQVKSGVWGAIGGLVVVLAAILVTYLKH